MGKVISMYKHEERRSFHIKGYVIWALTYEEALKFYQLITQK
jgi:hypothetical protein